MTTAAIKRRVGWTVVAGQRMLEVDMARPVASASDAAVFTEAALTLSRTSDPRVLTLWDVGDTTLSLALRASNLGEAKERLFPRVAHAAIVGRISKNRRALLDQLAEGRGAGFLRSFASRLSAKAWLSWSGDAYRL
jgi:hypothetical protein